MENDAPILAPKEQRFVDEYLIDLNASAAYRRAGYSGVSQVSANAYHLLSKPAVRDAVNARFEELKNRLGITQEKVLRELARVAFLDPRGFFRDDGSLKSPSELDEDHAAALQSLDVVEVAELAGDLPVMVKKARFADKLKALEILAKYLELAKEQVDVNVTVKKRVEDLTDEELAAIVEAGKKKNKEPR